MQQALRAPNAQTNAPQRERTSERVRRALNVPSRPARVPTPAGLTNGLGKLDRASLMELIRATAKHASPRRVAVSIPYFSTWAAVREVMSASQRLDLRLFPQINEQKIKAPVFIFANPRSGTTLLHRLMSLDEANFVSTRLFETIFTSASWLIGMSKLDDFDARYLGGLLHKGMDRVDELFFGSRWEDVHQLGFGKVEEDETFFLYHMQSPTTLLLVPFVDEVRGQGFFDDQPAHVRGETMDFYEAVLKRLLFVRGEGRRYLSKNVFNIPRIRTFHDRFPDGKFLYVVRHPYEVMPSFCNMFYAAWKTHSPEIKKDGPEMRALAEIGFEYYRRALALRQELPEENFRAVRYDDLVANPRATVEGIYRWMGADIEPGFRARLDEATAAQRSYERPIEHTLEEWGLSKEEVYRELAPVFEEYGFER